MKYLRLWAGLLGLAIASPAAAAVVFLSGTDGGGGEVTVRFDYLPSPEDTDDRPEAGIFDATGTMRIVSAGYTGTLPLAYYLQFDQQLTIETAYDVRDIDGTIRFEGGAPLDPNTPFPAVHIEGFSSIVLVVNQLRVTCDEGFCFPDGETVLRATLDPTSLRITPLPAGGVLLLTGALALGWAHRRQA